MFIRFWYDKPPLIKWPYGQKLWEKLETAAFCPRLMQIAWPWVPARRDLLLEMLPEVQSPQPSQGGGGGWQLLLGAVVGHSFLIMVFKCLPTWHFLHFGLQFCSLWAIILSHFWHFFWAFSHTSDFLKIVFPCRRELDFHHPGISKMIQKANTNRFSL